MHDRNPDLQGSTVRVQGFNGLGLQFNWVVGGCWSEGVWFFVLNLTVNRAEH